jgi:transmembrane sensor
VNPSGIESRQAIADTRTTLSWRHGRLTFDRERLRDVIEDVNRYSAIPIVLDDQQMGDVLITGTVSGSDITGWIASLQSAFGLRVERHVDRILLKRPLQPQ